jgi:hypothetical protein
MGYNPQAIGNSIAQYATTLARERNNRASKKAIQELKHSIGAAGGDHSEELY